MTQMLNLYTKNYRDFVLLNNAYEPVKIFSSAKNADKALIGDTVEATVDGCKLVARNQQTILVGLIELNSKTKYGYTSRNVPIYLFTPFNEAYPPFVVGCSNTDTSTNRLGLIKFESWTETFPRGNLIRLLDIGADEEALFWTYTPNACTNYKGPLPEPKSINDRPLIEAFHIDPPGCRDVDDVLTIDYDSHNTFITITISDVAETIAPDSPLDLRAQKIGQTLYQDGNKPKHMFPKELSEQSLSLLPGAIKPGLSLRFNIDDPTQITWFESLVKTTESYTYESIYKNPGICNTLTKMCAQLKEPSDDSHKWIEVAMKYYNVQVAKLLYEKKAGLLRTHEGPNLEKLKTLMQVNPELNFLAFQSANYVHASESNPYHYGLETALYTHVTSPIRRYADLVNQRVVKAILNKASMPHALNPYYLNYIGKQAKKHDRDLILIRALKNTQINSVSGQIVEIKSDSTQTKITVYVPSWHLLVKLRYATGTESNTIISKNTQEIHTIKLGQVVNLSYYADMTARSWKKRMVIKLQSK